MGKLLMIPTLMLALTCMVVMVSLAALAAGTVALVVLVLPSAKRTRMFRWLRARDPFDVHHRRAYRIIWDEFMFGFRGGKYKRV